MYTVQTLTLTQRLAYFGIITAIEVPICFGCGFFTLYVMRRRSPFHAALALAVTCSIVVAPGVGFAVLLYVAFHGGEFRQFNIIGIYWFGVLTFGGGSGLVFYVLCARVSRGSHAASVGSAPSYAAALSASQDSSLASSTDPAPDEGSDHPSEASDEAPSRRSAPQLHLPDELKGDIVYAHVSGHYVEIVATDRKDVLLMRLADVANALDGQGMQTHRSYWVAYRHIVRLEKYERNAVLHLTGGHKVPVSRSLRSEVSAYMARRDRNG